MKGNYDGIEIGKFITKLDIPFLYITAHSDQDMMARMLETNIKGFISKPIRRDQFLMNIKIVINQINLKPLNSIRLLTNRGYVMIVVDDIYFVKSIGNNLEINLENSQYVIRNTIASFLAELCLENFVQNHRSYIVNLNKVEISTAKELILKNKVCIPISRTYSQHFKS